MRKEVFAILSSQIIKMMDFSIENTEAERLRLLRSHFGLKNNQEVLKALIIEKCVALKLEKGVSASEKVSDKGYVCPVCKESFATPELLIRHSKSFRHTEICETKE